MITGADGGGTPLVTRRPLGTLADGAGRAGTPLYACGRLSGAPPAARGIRPPWSPSIAEARVSSTGPPAAPVLVVAAAARAPPPPEVPPPKGPWPPGTPALEALPLPAPPSSIMVNRRVAVRPRRTRSAVDVPGASSSSLDNTSSASPPGVAPMPPNATVPHAPALVPAARRECSLRATLGGASTRMASFRRTRACPPTPAALETWGLGPCRKKTRALGFVACPGGIRALSLESAIPYPNVPRAAQTGGTMAVDTVCRPVLKRGAAGDVRVQLRSTRGRRAPDAPRRHPERRRRASAQCALLRLPVPPIGPGRWRFFRHAYGCRQGERHGRRRHTTRYGPPRCQRRRRGAHYAAAQRCTACCASARSTRCSTSRAHARRLRATLGAAAGPTQQAYAGRPMRRVAQTERAAADRRAWQRARRRGATDALGVATIE